MKAVMLSVQPKWCEKITHIIGQKGSTPIYEKSVEIRKTRPKIETPFKCYIYCTKPKGKNDFGLCIDRGMSGNLKSVGLLYKCNYETAKRMNMTILSGKVIGEFICDRITRFKIFDDDTVQFWNFAELEKSCLTYEQVADYIGHNNFGYAYHISDLVIYDKPKVLSEFRTFCKDYFNGNGCEDCEHFIDGRGYEYDESECGCDGFKPLKRPPQSWCYVQTT